VQQTAMAPKQLKTDYQLSKLSSNVILSIPQVLDCHVNWPNDDTNIRMCAE
jgi:hypothetical protein